MIDDLRNLNRLIASHWLGHLDTEQESLYQLHFRVHRAACAWLERTHAASFTHEARKLEPTQRR